MPTDLENLITARSNVIAALASLTANPQPTYTKGNQTFDWTGMRRELNEELASLNARIAAFEGPWEIETRGTL
jgi:hypothetical protein